MHTMLQRHIIKLHMPFLGEGYMGVRWGHFGGVWKFLGNDWRFTQEFLGKLRENSENSRK